MDYADQLDMMDDDCNIEGFPLERLSETDPVSTLLELSNRLSSELDNFIVKDTFTKGKNCGLRKAIVTIEDMISEIESKGQKEL